MLEGSFGADEVAIGIFCLTASGLLLWLLYSTSYHIDDVYVIIIRDH